MNLNNINFNKYITENYAFENKPILAVAVSGGPDSIALTFLLKQWCDKNNGKLIALIVDHNIRKDSTEEAKNVSKYLAKNKINNKILNVKKSYVLKKNMQEARNNRFNKLVKYCKDNKILHLFLAHHKNDNLETFFIRKIASSDIEGLISIKRLNIINKVVIVRPLLDFYKKQIYKYNKLNKLNFIEDSSNKNLKHTRVFVRNFLQNSDQKYKIELEKDMKAALSLAPKFVDIVWDKFIKITTKINERNIVLDYNSILKIDYIILERIIVYCYSYLFHHQKNIKSSKIRNLINHLLDKNFKFFNFKSMIVKKTENTLIFSRK